MLRPILQRKIILVLILAFVIRLIGIASRPIWYDEAFSVLFSEKGLAAMLYGTLAPSGAGSADIHPLGYYTLLWLWMKVFGQTLLAVRSLSALAGLGVILLVYILGRDLFDENTALLAALFAAILPFQVHYAQEVRMYVFLALWLMLATVAFLRKQWILFAVSAALAQYTHNLAAIYLIPLAFTPIFQKNWKTLRALTLSGFAAILLYIPWLIHLPAQFSKVNASYWVERPGLERLFTLLLFYIPNLPLPDSQLWIGLLIAMLTIAIAAYQTFLALKQKRPDAQRGLWLAYLSFAPPVLLWLISQIVPVYIERALLPSHVIFSLWLAWGLTQTRLPRLIQGTVFALVLIAAVMGIYQQVTFKGFPYGPYAMLDKSLSERFKPGDIIVHSNKLSYLPSVYFDRGLSQIFITDPAGGSTDTLAPATRQIMNLNAAEDAKSATQGASRVWFIIFRQSIEEMKAQGYATHPQLQYLSDNFKLESVENWDDLRVYLYTRNAP